MQSLKITCSRQTNKFSLSTFYRFYSDRKGDKPSPIPVNVLDIYGTAGQQSNGPMVDKKPFRMALKAERRYNWCLCGKSKSQPICDGTHKYVHYKIKEKPIPFKVEKDGDYWLCMCKQTKHRPFCDGTHKEEFVQEAFKKY